MKTLQQILGAKNLTGLIRSVNGGVPTDILAPELFTVTRTVEGNYATYRQIQNTRQTARRAEYGAKAHERKMQGMQEVPVTLIHTVESQRHKPTTLMNLTQMESESKQRLGQQEVARQVEEFGRLFNNLRASAVYSVFANGAIYFDLEGNLSNVPVAGGITVDMKVPADNKGNLGGILTDWSAAGALIATQVASVKEQARKTSGYKVEECWYGANILDYLLLNNQVKELLKANTALSASFTAGIIPDGFLGLKWRAVQEAFFNDAAGVDKDFFGDDYVGFMPTASREWWEVLEGTYPVPTMVGGTVVDANAALNTFDVEAGMFSYASVEGNPSAIEHVAGDTFLPTLKVPAAVWLGKAKP